MGSNALFLTGGGARGAYQAGVLKGISSYCGNKNPFSVLVGTSAGAINCAYLAGSIYDKTFYDSAHHLGHIWSDLQSGNIFSTNPMSMMLNGSKWVRLLAGGGIGGDAHNISLLNTKRLARFLAGFIKFTNIEKSLESGKIDALGITALCYRDGNTRTFFESSKEIPAWNRNLREGVPARIGLGHVLASASIPVLFPSHKVEGDFYGDGSVRNLAPLSPSIKLGGRKILVINVKAKKVPLDINPVGPSLAQILGTLLHGLMLDNLSLDEERVHSVNEILRHSNVEGIRHHVETLKVSPSRNISEIAVEEFENLPGSLRYFMKGLGNPKESAELLSYVLFESNFTSRLVQLGYQDALHNKEKISQFLNI